MVREIEHPIPHRSKMSTFFLSVSLEVSERTGSGLLIFYRLDPTPGARKTEVTSRETLHSDEDCLRFVGSCITHELFVLKGMRKVVRSVTLFYFSLMG